MKMGRTAWDEYQILVTMETAVCCRSQLDALDPILITYVPKRDSGQRLKELSRGCIIVDMLCCSGHKCGRIRKKAIVSF